MRTGGRADRRNGGGGGASTVIGVPGGGLRNGKGGTADWAANAGVAKAGQDGEVLTAKVLNDLASRRGCTVLHDLDMPGSNRKANIDHIVVSGRVVTILDSKRWKPGFFWTLAGRTRRGWKPFPYADKQTMPMAATAIRKYLDSFGVTGYRIAVPVVVVWPTNTRDSLSLWATRFPGARLIAGAKFERKAGKLCGSEAADPQIVAALSRMVVSVRAQQRDSRHGSQSGRQPAVYRQTSADPYASDSYTVTGPDGTELPPLPADVAGLTGADGIATAADLAAREGAAGSVSSSGTDELDSF